MTKWIKCSERLPPCPKQGNVNVIVACYNEERKIFHISAAEFQRGKFYDRFGEQISPNDCYWPITHWMPFPEAPTHE